MNVLIIGGLGQLGTTLAQIAPQGTTCRSVDLPEFDITHPEQAMAVVTELHPDVVINASAYTAVDQAEKDADLAFRVNADGPRNLALAAKSIGCRMIHVSTDYVFDGTACRPYSPQSPCNPIGVYGQSKRQGEINLFDILHDALIVRTSWLYSRFGSNFVLTMLRLIRERDELKVVADQVGAPTWARTLAEVIWKAVEKPALSGIYHWSDAGVASWYDFAVAIQEEGINLNLLDRSIPITSIRTEEYPTMAERPSYSLLDCSRSRRDMDVAPMHWRVALRRMLGEMGVQDREK